jgi:hypothetical protein
MVKYSLQVNPDNNLRMDVILKLTTTNWMLK